MGDRAQVHFKESDVYLYTHWGGHHLLADVAEALAKRECWSQHEYLTRIIFDEMVGKDQGEPTGYGIGDAEHGDVHTIVHVNCEAQMIYVEERGIREASIGFDGSFEEFIDEYQIDNPEQQ